MDWRALLFSPNGRINRAKYWLTVLIYLVVWLLFVVVAAVLMGGIRAAVVNASSGAGLILGVVGFVLIVGAFWSGIAVAIKRLHDRDKSGWWLLLFWLGPSVLNGIGATIGSAGQILFGLASVVITLWAFVELGCLQGTEGPNQYGPDPLSAS